jgi:DNA polymerase-3 subunit alpha
MGKKDKEKMAKERANFIAGCARTNNIGERKANAIFDLLEKFAGYGFNKSHSAAYALISYETAYLKANYPVEFMAGLLSNEINNTDKISVLVGECKRMGITILPPDVNRSGLKFVPETVAVAAVSDRREEDSGESDGHTPPLQGKAIRFGLAAIKNVGQTAMELAIRERERGGEFKSLEDFCSRLDSRVANRKMLESLVRCGAFDFLQRERAELFACIDDALAASAAALRDRMAGQVSLFGDEHEHVAPPRKRSVPPWSDREKMSYEKELLGFYVTGHPLDAYAAVIANGKYQTIASLTELSDRATFRVAGAITQVDKKFTRKEGKPFAVVWLEDLTGTLELVIWNELYLECAEKLVPGNVVGVRGKLDLRDESLRATAEKLSLLSSEVSRNSNANGSEMPPLCLRFSANAGSDELREVQALLAASPGQQPVRLFFETAEGETVRVDAGANFHVSVTAELEQRLQRWLIAEVEKRARESEQGTAMERVAVARAMEY